MVIKYKCWDSNKKEWRKPDVDNLVSMFVPEGLALRIVPPEGYEFILWTGEMDSDGTEIYPGDILDDKYYVRWDVLNGAWGLFDNGPDSISRARFDEYPPARAKITGNVYETPEWIETKK